MSGTLEMNIISPAEASGDVQAGFDFANAALPLGNVFPVKSNGGSLDVAWQDVVPAKTVNAMEFRAWDAEAAHTDTVAVSAENVARLLPMSDMAHISERELAGHIGDNNWIHDAAEEKFTELGRRAAVRMELARISLLMDAKIPVDMNGLKKEYTFNRPKALSKLTPTAKWSNADSTPLADMEIWANMIVAQRGRTPGAVLTTSKVIDALRTNKSIIETYTQRSYAESMSRLTRQQVIEVLATEGLQDVRMIDILYRDVENTNGFKLPVDVNTLIPDDTFIMFPAFGDTGLGFTASGPTVEAANPEYGINKAVNDGMVGAMYASNSPVKYDLWANGTMIPVLQEGVSTGKASGLL